jgi:hypothetical protein
VREINFADHWFIGSLRDDRQGMKRAKMMVVVRSSQIIKTTKIGFITYDSKLLINVMKFSDINAISNQVKYLPINVH